METPSSTRRVTRSMVSQSGNNNNIPNSRKNDDSEMGFSKSRGRKAKQQDRSALIDITNDSPIVGLAMQTPSSAVMKQRSIRAKGTPGSGEALLRGQVKTLLQQVEEEAVLSKISLPFRHLQGFIGNSPTGLLAPTPANTPQVSDLSVDGFGSNFEKPSPMGQEQLISQVIYDIFEGKNQESLESQKSGLSRSLLLDFSEKSEISASEEDCSSVITTESKERLSPDDDSASMWSIQVNASTHDEEEEEAIEEDEDYFLKLAEEEEENHEDGGFDVDELCECISKIYVNKRNFEGKHTRFVYNSDDEIVEEEVEDYSPRTPDSADVRSPSALRLKKGLPTPRGKHLRFLDEADSGFTC